MNKMFDVLWEGLVNRRFRHTHLTQRRRKTIISHHLGNTAHNLLCARVGVIISPINVSKHQTSYYL